MTDTSCCWSSLLPAVQMHVTMFFTKSRRHSPIHNLWRWARACASGGWVRGRAAALCGRVARAGRRVHGMRRDGRPRGCARRPPGTARGPRGRRGTRASRRSAWRLAAMNFILNNSMRLFGRQHKNVLFLQVASSILQEFSKFWTILPKWTVLLKRI